VVLLWNHSKAIWARVLEFMVWWSLREYSA
jgi:hypothetical protein